MSKKDYEVGHGKPPKHSQFQKGRSGNPSGRKKRRPTTAELFERELASTVSVSEQGKKKRLPKSAVVVKKAVQMAMQGDHRAMKLVFDHCPAAQDEAEAAMRFTLKLEDDDTGRG